MNFDEFAFMAESNAKTWFDNYYDMCANEEFGFDGLPPQPPPLGTNNQSQSNIPNPSSHNRSNLDDNKTTPTAIVSTTNNMQAGTDTATPVPVSILNLFVVKFYRKVLSQNRLTQLTLNSSS